MECVPGQRSGGCGDNACHHYARGDGGDRGAAVFPRCHTPQNAAHPSQYIIKGTVNHGKSMGIGGDACVALQQLITVFLPYRYFIYFLPVVATVVGGPFQGQVRTAARS